MKKRMMVVLLGVICGCASVSHAGQDALTGTWRGVVRKGALESVVTLEFSRTDAGYRGSYWGAAPVGAPIPLRGIELGHSVRFEVPLVGMFEGEIGRDAMQGTFDDAQGTGSFVLEKQSERDNPLLSI